MTESSSSTLARIEAVARKLDAWGCTSDEIAAVQADQGVPLPASYEAFLCHLGRDGGGILGGTDVCFAEILGARRHAIALLDENRRETPEIEVFRLPGDAVVISMHQGYVFEFVRGSLGDDPPVELWGEGTGHPERSKICFASIADWVENLGAALPPERARAHRIETQAQRRRVYVRERCPSCGSELEWGGELRFHADDPNSGRGRVIATCRIENKQFWRWGDEPSSPLLTTGFQRPSRVARLLARIRR